MAKVNDEYTKMKEKIDKMIEEQDNERATDIFVTTKNNKEFGLNLTTNITESILIDDKQIPVKISNSAIEILQDFVSNEKSKLVDFANEYQTSGRQFYSFLYDVVALVKYLDDLPKEFLKLTKIKGKADSLMHSRIQAEVAATNYKNGNVDLEIKNKKGKKMDLIIDDVETEIKTIISPSENNKEACIKFANTVKDKFEEAQEQFFDKGVLCIAPWSIITNNILKEYYAGLYSNKMPDIKKDKSILVLWGENAFEDYFLEFESNKIVTSTHFFANTGYDNLSQLAYLDMVTRRGFPVSRGGSLQDISKAGFFYFKMN